MIGEILKNLRKNNHITQQKMANDFNVAIGTISMWEANKRTPDSYTLAKLAVYFDVSVDYILGVNKDIESFNGADIDNISSHIEQPTKIAVLGTIRAGIPNSAIEDILDYEEITEEMAKHGKHFALKIKGNSMFPNLIEDDVVIFRECEDAESGDVCAVLVNGDEATVKKIKKTEQGLYLIPFNTTDFEPMFYTNEDIENKPVKIIGKAVEIRRSL